MNWISLYARLGHRWWLPGSWGLYLAFRAGLVLRVARAKLSLIGELTNPWAVFAKAAANGLVRQDVDATRYWRSLRLRGLGWLLRERLALYLGRQNPALALSVLKRFRGHSHLISAINRSSLGVRTPAATASLSSGGRATVRCVDAINQRFQHHGLSFRVGLAPDSSFGFRVQDEPAQVPFVAPQNWPLVSVILTVHDAERYVSEAVASVLSQSYSNLELLVVDDASTDRTPQILKELCVSDRRVRVFTLGQNVGTYVAKSFAAGFARGEMLTCHDADDLATPEWISLQMEPLLRSGNCVATISDWFRVSESGALLPGSSRGVCPVESRNQTSLLVRREALDRTGLWDTARVSADVEFYERLRNVYGHRAVVSVRKPLVVGLHRAESLMNDSTVGLTESNTEQLRRHLAYRESWVNWHVACLRQGRVPRMSSVLSRIRPFWVPREFRVSPGLIREEYSKLTGAVREESHAS
jgi:hypothetical protein